MAKRTSNENSISEVLKMFIETNNLQKGIDRVSIQEAWYNLLGNGIKSYTQEVVLKNSTLYVKLSSAVVREELSMGKQKIIDMLNDEMGKQVITDLILR
ncbi:uncharacterized protein DUF721 [Flavobacterium croceum DSM 17960]|uniref:Uncharacterized protein DUF721 n=1 Tax=Flavobacterium croceum DSM 17960 TaxID=1121886 RepID=A0A2S4N8F4_9FLAO|nr:DUF721 domain-containing protein [Flavobacterium croceum]POS01713.1 uncharacterized protein DUF721 [Flavobacterium croceum DSM 17960]